MRISFLLFIAAVPLLGEAQLNKPRNEAKKGKKMAKEEMPSSCLTGSTISTQEEMPPLVMELPRSVKLFGQPGTRHRSPLALSNLIWSKWLICLVPGSQWGWPTCFPTCYSDCWLRATVDDWCCRRIYSSECGLSACSPWGRHERSSTGGTGHFSSQAGSSLIPSHFMYHSPPSRLSSSRLTREALHWL